jgi:tripartite-type tricarboxylate transporter receptor subunit TctC
MPSRGLAGKRTGVAFGYYSIAIAALAWSSATGIALAQGDISFAGKFVTLTVGFEAGSGPDIYGRILGQNLVRYLPGQPRLIVVNQLGAGGVVALNSWANKAEPNGLFVALGTLSQTDPDALIRTQAKYDPATFNTIGGLAGPSKGLFVNKDAVARLHDKSAKPVIMGTVGTTLRSGHYQVLWGVAFLGWNVKWVVGYTRTAELRQAMERGEIDMTSFGAAQDIDYLRSTGRFAVVSQSGTVEGGRAHPRPNLGDAPLIADLLKGKIKEPLAQKAYAYGEYVSQIGSWIALPPQTPDGIIGTYVGAFEATLQDAEYRSELAKIDPDSPVAHKADLDQLIGELAKVSPETLSYIQAELKRQGFD